MAPSSLPQLSLENVSKSFGGLVASDRVCLQVRPSEIVGLIGPNGSGKTTLFNLITGIVPLESGTIRFNGQRIDGLSTARIARRGILRTFQKSRTYDGMTALENVTVSMPHRHMRLPHLARLLPAAAVRRAGELIGFVGLNDQQDKYAGELSFGQKRLLEIAMALMNGPQMLLLDEPTAGINPAALTGLVDCLLRVKSELGISLVVIEHNMPVVMDMADRIYCLDHGHVLTEGTPAQIQSDQRVINAYLGMRQAHETQPDIEA